MTAVLGRIAWNILACCCWPCCVRSERRAVRRSQIRLGYLQDPNYVAPKSMVSGRRRALTLLSSIPRSSHDDEPATLQSPCMLLAELPIEIRQQIWRECLGGMTFHLHLWQTLEEAQIHLGHIICRSPCPEMCDELKGPKGCYKHSVSPPAPETPKRHLLSILLTCHQIYSEAIHYLYDSNTFVTKEPRVVQYLSCFFLPQRIISIRSFRFKWYRVLCPEFPSPDNTSINGLLPKNLVWEAIWKSFAEMRGLSELRVKLATHDEDWGSFEDSEKVILLLKPVMEVTSPSFFELSLPFPCNSDEALWEALPCRLRRTRMVEDL